MGELAKLPNVGKVLEGNLARIGVDTAERLREMGYREAFLRIRAQADPGACLHMLYGLEGAIRGVPDKDLPREVKDELREFFNAL